MASTDPNVIETDDEKDVRAAKAFEPIILNLLRPHLTTKEFVTTVREEVLTRVWDKTDASIYSDPSIKTLLLDVTSGTVSQDTFFSPDQTKQIMKQFRLLGRINSFTFDQGTHSFTDANNVSLASQDVEILWITFVNSDAIGLPVGFTASTIPSNDITYNGVTYTAGSILFALKFAITDVTTRAAVANPVVATIVSEVENVTWLYVPGGGRKAVDTF
jgi:hypothetical protein